MLKLSPEHLRRLRRVAVNSGFGLLVFIVALYIWFPYGRAKEVAINAAAAQDLDVEIDSAGPAWGIGVKFSDIRVKTRPLTGKPTRFTIDSASVTVSLFSLLFSSSPSYDISLNAFGGSIDFAQQGVAGRKTPFSVELRVRDVNMSEVPGVKEAINLPLAGKLKMDVELSSATGTYATSKGEISFACTGCVLGDGKTPLRVEGNPFLGGGLTLPRLRLGDLVGEIAIEKGTAKFKGIEAKSPDVEVALEGEAQLRDPLPYSTLNAYLRFKLSDAFLKTAANLQTILQMAASSGRRPDGSYGLRLSGRLGQLSPPALSPVSPFGGGAGMPSTRPGIRPSGAPAYIPAQPPPPPAPVAAPTNMEPPPPPPPPPEMPPPPPPPENQPILRGTPPPAPAPTVGDAPPAPPPAPAPPPPGEEAQPE